MKTPATSSPRPAFAAWLILLLLTLFFGAGLLWYFSLPYAQAHGFANHLSRDHNFQRFTPALYALLQTPSRALGALLLALGLALAAFPRRAQTALAAVLAWVVAMFKRLPRDTRSLEADFSPGKASKWGVIAVVLLTLAALLARWLFMSYPMRHDEAYTYIAFAVQPWLALISDYSLPNNHIFHTLLVKLATILFGVSPWTVRLPALISGVLCVPAVYLLAQRLYGRNTAILSAALVAFSPKLIDVNTTARGYSQYALFGLILFGLVIYLRDHRNLAAWLLLTLVSILGFYTFPMMLYPFGSALAWLLVCAALGETRAAYGSRFGILKYMFGVGLITALVSVALYLPIVLWGSGLSSFVANGFVAGLSWRDFPQSMQLRLDETWQGWTYDLAPWLGLLGALGFGLSLIFHRRISRIRVPIQLTTLGFLVLVLLIQRPNAWERIWTFLIPLTLMWAAAGFIAPLEHLKWPARFPVRPALLLALLSILALGAATWQRTRQYYPALQTGRGSIEQFVAYLQPRLTPQDAVLVNARDAPSMWFYLFEYGIPQSYATHLERRTFNHVYLVINTSESQTPASVIQGEQMDPARFDLAHVQRLLSIGDVELYQCPTR